LRRRKRGELESQASRASCPRANPIGNSEAIRQSVGVVIVNWNGGQYLERCLAALRDQTLAPDQIIVVDNASTDGSPEKLARNFPNVTLIRLKNNLGFAAANNLAVRDYANTHWVALLNPDAFAAPDWLETLLRTAEAHPEYGFFGSCMLRAEQPTQLDGTGDCYHVSGVVWRRDRGVPVESGHRRAGEIFAPCAAAALYRRDIFLAAGGFDEDFFCYVEDVDLGFRLRLAGQRCLYAAAAIVYHVGSGLTGKQSDFSTYHGHRNLIWCFVRNMPTPLFWIYLPQHLLLNLLSVLALTLRGQGAIVLRAKRDALRGLSGALRKRRRQQRAIAVNPWRLRRLMETGWSSFFRHRGG
jgi:GT2 family glycosyltransferase